MRMIISFSRLLFLIFTGISYIATSQSSTLIYESEADLNWKLGKGWSINTGTGSRHLIEDDLNFRQLEVSQNTSYQVGFYAKISLGTTYRWRNNFNQSRKDEVLLTGQYAYSKKLTKLKVAHRFQSQLRLRSELSINRNRYRFSLEWPLSGRVINTKELFLIGSTEALWSISKKIKPELGQRFSIEIGYQMSKTIQLITGTQLRFDNYNLGVSQSIFFNSGIVMSL
jgi:hypothetical protein